MNDPLFPKPSKFIKLNVYLATGISKDIILEISILHENIDVRRKSHSGVAKLNKAINFYKFK